jgi:AraC family transcriptional regulator
MQKIASKEKLKSYRCGNFERNLNIMANNPETYNEYLKRINKVLVHIDHHLDEKLDLESLAGISNFSPFHFHRIIRAYLGESLGSYIVRIRMETAATLILYTPEPISEIALRVGYDIPSSFNKAFIKHFGCPPTEFKNKHISINPIKFLSMETNSHEVKLKPAIKVIKPKNVVFIQSIGDYSGEGTARAWQKISEFAKHKKLFGWKTEFIGVSHDDPHITETEKLRYDACITVTKDVSPEGEIGVRQIQGGRFAIFMHKGPYEYFQKTYDAIFRQWLPSSGHKLRSADCFEKYLNSPQNTKPENLKTEIYIPVE